MSQELPEFVNRIYEKPPELMAIDKALKQFTAEEEITARCPTCSEVLTVTDIKVIDTLWVNCPNSHIVYRMMYKSRK